MKKKSASQSAFFNSRVLIGVLLCFVGVTLAFLAFRNASAQGNSPQQAPIQAQYRGLSPVVHFDISPPLRDITPIPPGPCTLRENEDRDIVPRNFYFGFEPDPVVQSTLGQIEIPPPLISFDGPPNLCGCAPPDPNGEVGPNHVVVMSNLSFQIFNKTGTSLFGPVANNTLWSGFGGHCQTENAGDPVVLYDQQADRWILSQFTAATAPFLNCVAVSQTSDPTGAYFRYAFMTGTTGANFPDYPKYGIWPDAYYISTREFAGSSFAGVGAYALNRAQMLVGNPTPQVISFLVPPGGTPYLVGDGLLPADLDGPTLPPAGSPEYFLGSMDNNGPYGAPQDALNLYKFHVDFAVPTNSTFALTNTLPTASFNSILGLCGGSRACIPQPGTTNKIDHLGYRQRPLHRLAYRNFGTHESLVTNQSVSAGTGPNGEVSGIRWWELRSPNSSPVIFQEGTYAPGLTDGIHRWMGSIAMDGAGNMGLGYSASNGTVFPSVFYTGRLAADPLGTMSLGENSIIHGTGSQTGSNRWGDYTAISVDPTDDLTFWYVNEYVPTTSASGWRLRIGSFKALPGGASPTPFPTATPATPTPTATPSPSGTPSPTPCGTLTFSNPALITINDAGVASPYPSNITVAGVTNPVTKVTVTITGFNHTFPSDVDMLLVGPGGQKFILVSDVIGGTDAVAINWTFDDAAAAFIGSTGTPASGTFKPTNYTVCQDPFAAPAPAGAYLSPGGIGTPCGTDTLAAFNGVNPNGTWSLYVVDDLGADVGTITGGWSLSIQVSGAVCATPTPSPSATATPSATPTPTPTQLLLLLQHRRPLQRRRQLQRLLQRRRQPRHLLQRQLRVRRRRHKRSTSPLACEWRLARELALAASSSREALQSG